MCGLGYRLVRLPVPAVLHWRRLCLLRRPITCISSAMPKVGTYSRGHWRNTTAGWWRTARRCGGSLDKTMRYWFRFCVLCASVVYAQSLDKGIELVRQQKFEAARAEFEAVLRADPRNGRAAALLAAAELQTGLVKSGIARAEILLEKDPKNLDLHELLGQGYMVAREWEKAEREWRWMTAERPNSEQAHMQLAAAL